MSICLKFKLLVDFIKTMQHTKITHVYQYKIILPYAPLPTHICVTPFHVARNFYFLFSFAFMACP